MAFRFAADGEIFFDLQQLCIFALQGEKISHCVRNDIKDCYAKVD
jgi:hypothetical protein